MQLLLAGKTFKFRFKQVALKFCLGLCIFDMIFCMITNLYCINEIFLFIQSYTFSNYSNGLRLNSSFLNEERSMAYADLYMDVDLPLQIYHGYKKYWNSQTSQTTNNWKNGKSTKCFVLKTNTRAKWQFYGQYAKYPRNMLFSQFEDLWMLPQFFNSDLERVYLL